MYKYISSVYIYSFEEHLDAGGDSFGNCIGMGEATTEYSE